MKRSLVMFAIVILLLISIAYGGVLNYYGKIEGIVNVLFPGNFTVWNVTDGEEYVGSTNSSSIPIILNLTQGDYSYNCTVKNLASVDATFNILIICENATSTQSFYEVSVTPNGSNTTQVNISATNEAQCNITILVVG